MASWTSHWKMAISIDTLTQKGEFSWGLNPKNWWQGNWWLLKGRISLLLRMKLITCLIENGQPWNHVHRQEKWLGRLYLYVCSWMCKYVNVCIVCVCTHMCICVRVFDGGKRLSMWESGDMGGVGSRNMGVTGGRKGKRVSNTIIL